MSDAQLKVITTVTAVVFRANGEVEDLGVVSSSETSDPSAVAGLQAKLESHINE